MSKKHVQVAHELDIMRSKHILEHGDKIIYAAIRIYMNVETRECYPALNTIATKLKCSKTKIINALERLLTTGLINKHFDGRKNHYYFPETEFDKQFEMFTEEFLELELPLNVKEYYMDIQPFLYGKETGIGKCSFSNAELARRTGWTVPSIKKYNTYLIEHGFLEEETTDKKDSAGFPIVQKNFDLQSLNQAALWAKKITEQVIMNTSDIEQMKKELEELKEWKKRKEREESLKRNYVEQEIAYPM